MTTPLRTLIVDDEPLARQGLSVRLEREAGIAIVGEANDGPSAVAAILSLRPDLVFLDIQMPGCDGFDVISRVGREHLPGVIFVTAYDQFALQAFSVHALDYLLKPISDDRFRAALERARAALARADDVAAEQVRALLDAREAAGSTSYPVRFTVRDGERYVLLRTADVDWVEAAANYLVLHAGARSFQLRMTMTELERRLDPSQFARVHRSTLVNLDRIASIEPEQHGEYQVVLKSGARRRLSRSYRDRLL
jgi:two-component system LytT family response regulator